MHLISLNGLQNENLFLSVESLDKGLILDRIASIYNISKKNIYISSHINNKNALISINVHYKIVGGKGGFGSMLRAIGAQIEKTTNKGACRDLSGRRMRDVNAEKALKEWVKNNPDAEVERERKKQEKRDRILNPGKHYITDADFINQRSNIEENIDNALKQGLSGTSLDSLGNKRKTTSSNSQKMTKLFKHDIDDTISSTDESSDDDLIGIQKAQKTSHKLQENIGEPSTNLLIDNDIQLVTVNGSHKSSHISYNKNDELIEDSEQTTKAKTIIIQSETICEATQNTSDSNSIIKPIKEEVTYDRIDLSHYNAIEDVELLGLDHLKNELKLRGLKCGGTLRQRAQRLFDTKKL